MTVESLRPQRSGIIGRLGGAYNFFTRWPVIPIVILVILVLAAVFAPVISKHKPLDGNLRERNLPPWGAEEGTTNHIFGTDHVGRDIFSRVVHGSRVSLMVAAVALVNRDLGRDDSRTCRRVLWWCHRRDHHEDCRHLVRIPISDDRAPDCGGRRSRYFYDHGASGPAGVVELRAVRESRSPNPS